MKVDSNSRTGRLGVASVQLKFEKMRWIFREQPIEDYGIDAHVEIVENGIATGELIALQIKSGSSWFKEKNNKNSIIFRDSFAHFNYWLRYSIPVIIVLYNPENEVAYWQVISKHSAIKTKKDYKLKIPFCQKIDESSTTLLKQISRKMAFSQDYTILSLKDVSHSMAKRYSADILINKEITKESIAQLVIKITNELTICEYYRNDIVKQRRNEKTAQVIWLYLYLSLEDERQKNWICRTQWIDEALPPEFSPVKLSGDIVENNIVIDWKENYEEINSFYQSHTLTKEIFLKEMQTLLIDIKNIINKIEKLTQSYKKNDIDEENYITFMKSIEKKLTALYFKATNIGLAPLECSYVSQKFQNVIAISHNVVLPFSEIGFDIWTKKERDYLINKSIQDYNKELLRLDFELEKIH